MSEGYYTEKGKTRSAMTSEGSKGAASLEDKKQKKGRDKKYKDLKSGGEGEVDMFKKDDEQKQRQNLLKEKDSKQRKEKRESEMTKKVKDEQKEREDVLTKEREKKREREMLKKVKVDEKQKEEKLAKNEVVNCITVLRINCEGFSVQSRS